MSNVNPDTRDELHLIDAYWRAANYLAVGQIYLQKNPLLREPFETGHIKKMLLGHWGTTPGQNFIYAHLNRIIKLFDLNMIYISGPGHGGPAMIANTYLEGSYSEFYPDITLNEAGLQKLFKQFSFPGGIPSHVSPECPGSIHEGGELGYSLSHAFGAAFDNPDLTVACVIGDGEAETGALATAWHSNKFLNPATDGVVLPILHLNGFKIANPTILARIPKHELQKLFEGYGWLPLFVEGEDPMEMHEKMSRTLDDAISKIQAIRKEWKEVVGNLERPVWPMIILRTPKGWTGPSYIDNKKNTGTFHSHQVPISDPHKNATHFQALEDWLRSYRPEELFDDNGRLISQLQNLAPVGEKRMGANPNANGGLLLKGLLLPDYRDFAVDVESPGSEVASDTLTLGKYLSELIKLNDEHRNFRIFGPDEVLSNKLNHVFEATKRQWTADRAEDDEFLAQDGRVMEMLSEHQCQGWLEGYLLTGRHGLFTSYEAFIHIVDSMFNQHAKWLNVTLEISWRKKIASFNYLLTSHVWRQDHNGFTHQDPGFLDVVLNKKSEIIRVYLPPDADTLLSAMDHCFRTKHYINVIIAGKHPAPQWLNVNDATEHCRKGIDTWTWASTAPDEPDVIMACAGDVPTLETLAAVSILKRHLSALKIRVINVVDLMRLQSHSEHPHGLADADFDKMFTTNKPVIFAFHGYRWLIHRLIYKRTNHANFHVHGYIEEGTITTPFDMTVLNNLDRFHLVLSVLEHMGNDSSEILKLKSEMQRQLSAHREYINEYGEDMPEIKNWKWE